MTEVPEDIDRVATEIARSPMPTDCDADFELYLRIAKAIKAERERCAKIAQTEAARNDEVNDGEWSSGGMNASERIRDAILRGDQP